MEEKKQNLALLCDFYEFTMAQGYFLKKLENELCYFEVFFRKIPDNGSFAIFAGLESILEFIENLHFDKEDIDFLRKQKIFCEEFLEYLSHFKFMGTIYSINEGEIIFPNEPLMIIKANPIEAQLLETFILLNINHQSLIATKANRIKRVAQNALVFEFGARRAHGSEAAINGARSAYIAGFDGTSCTLSAKIYDIKAIGTMAHSWIQMFNDEYEAFITYLKLYPNQPILLIDTYDVKKGLLNAINAFKSLNITKGAVRLDSGDLLNLSKFIRKELDLAGLKECKIIASNSLDEFIIEDLVSNNAPIDAYGVGERLITAKSDPIFGCVYKLVAIQKDEIIKPKIKISENSKKTIYPHLKKLYRIYDKSSHKALYDKLLIYDEKIILKKEYYTKELLNLVFKDGKRIKEKKDLEEIRSYLAQGLKALDPNFLALKSKTKYKLKFSNKLLKIKNSLTKTI
ncbi:nicotinate phosphoribosyltransferase [Campylobacter novaezeelandiae]|uniref:Nicotinate phosphoribosyltransferase n=1 Tax=Campylobacter novaezeelandiae TaxID=2267891 RepID=A0A4Q9JSH5_9BACT|nr:nicotinate phosphoribosyltransferase [Campylobacter novaezeelandiae]TBR78549.1 nicotinate phosphoribosyltransferase [Campylobacter novaezeelandiae]